MTIRKIQQKDNLDIAAVIRKVLTEHGMNKDGTVFTDPTTDDLFSLFQTTGSVYFVVEEQGEIVGGCGIYPTKGLPKTYAELVKLYVLKRQRGKGLGRELLELCAKEAKKMGYSHLYLESMPELNKAVDLYKRVGYKKVDKPMGDSGHFACNLWMLKKLDG